MQVNTSRKTIKVPAESADLDYKTLKQVKERIDELIKEYGENATVDWHEPAYDNSQYLYVFEVRPETDAEMAERIAREEHHAKAREEYERREFERLKSKFSNT